MSNIGKKERETQDRVIKIFTDKLNYHYLGNWEEREDNSNLEEEILREWLLNKMKYSKNLDDKTVYEFSKAVNE